MLPCLCTLGHPWTHFYCNVSSQFAEVQGSNMHDMFLSSSGEHFLAYIPVKSDSTSKDSPVAFAKKGCQADLLVRKPAAEERQLLLLLELYAGALQTARRTTRTGRGSTTRRTRTMDTALWTAPFRKSPKRSEPTTGNLQARATDV